MESTSTTNSQGLPTDTKYPWPQVNVQQSHESPRFPANEEDVHQPVQVPVFTTQIFPVQNEQENRQTVVLIVSCFRVEYCAVPYPILPHCTIASAQSFVIVTKILHSLGLYRSLNPEMQILLILALSYLSCPAFVVLFQLELWLS